MGIVIDILLVAIYAFIVFLASRRGFVVTLIDLIGSFLAIALSVKLAGTAASWIYETYLREEVLSFLSSNLPAGISGLDVSLNPQLLLDAMPGYVSSFITRFDLMPSEEFFSSLGSTLSVSAIEAKIAAPVITVIVKMICLVVLAIVLLIVIKILARIISAMIKQTPLKKFNTLLGAILGALKGLIVIAVICFALIAVSSFMAESSFTLGVAGSKICGLFSSISNVF